MEKGFIPKDRGSLVKWILCTAVENNRKIVLEYSGLNIHEMLLAYATEISLPPTAKHHYHEAYDLIAIVDPRINIKFI